MFLNTRKLMGATAVVVIGVGPAMAQFPVTTWVQDLDGHNGFRLRGMSELETPWVVTGIGDVNADGIDDLGVGGAGGSLNPCVPGYPCPTFSGVMWVIFGRGDVAGDGEWNVGDIDGSNGFAIYGPYENGWVSPAPAGDFNADGVDDFLVGVFPSPASAGGEVFVIFGRPGLGGGGSPFDLTTLALDGTEGFRIWSQETIGFGRSHMDDIGDFNGDGASDIVLSSSDWFPGANAGARVYILYGGMGVGESGIVLLPDSVTAETGLIINSPSPQDRMTGTPAGDFNGDGFSDLLLHAPDVQAQPGIIGRAYVVYGGERVGADEVLSLGELDGKNGFIIDGPPGDPSNPSHLVFPDGIGDINGDGYDDVAVGVSWVAVIWGGPNVGPDGSFCLEPSDGDGVTRFTGVVGAWQIRTGENTGDLNHDGTDDVLMGIRGVLGYPGMASDLHIHISDILDGQHAFEVRAPWPGIHWQNGITDINGDGIADTGAIYQTIGDLGEFIGNLGVVFGRRMGDSDIDADVDFVDFGAFQACFRSELSHTDPDGEPDVPDDCHPFDFDKDHDVDLLDYAAFQEAFGTAPQ